jgi:HSP20 family molecular chaperone IbpA
MTSIQRYHAADLPELMEKITKNSIGLDDYFNSFLNFPSQNNYPPYNLIQINNHESRLEVALAGFKREEVHVYTEHGKLCVEGAKLDKEQEEAFKHQGVARRDFKRSWTLADDTEVREVKLEDGLLTIDLGKVVPEHHQRKDYI